LRWLIRASLSAASFLESPQYNRFIMVMNTVAWFLEKLALRGELTWSNQSIPLEEHLKLFEEMIIGYIDQSLNPNASASTENKDGVTHGNE
jgi:hypothetical protein